MYQFFPYIYLLMASCLMMVMLAVFAGRYKRNKGIKELIFTMIVLAWWAFCQIFELMAISFEVKLFWANALYLGAGLSAFAHLLMSMRFAGFDKYISKKNIAIVSLIYLVFFSMIFTDTHFGLMRTNFSLDTSAVPYVISKDYGIAFPFYLIFTYGMNIVAFTMLFFAGRKKNYIYKRQCRTLFGGMIFIALSNMCYVLKVFGDLRFDFAPALLVCSATVYFIGVTKYKLFDLKLFARDVIIEEMPSGIIAVNNENIIMDFNNWIEVHFQIERKSQIGKKAIKNNMISKALKMDDNTKESYTFTNGHSIYNIVKYRLTRKNDEYIGTVYVVNDITQMQNNTDKLMKQEKTIGIMQEREKIGRDLHDEIGQVFGYYNTKAQAVKTYLVNDEIDNAKKHLDELLEISFKGQRDIRSFVMQMRGISSQNLGFSAMLKQYIYSFTEQTAIAVDIWFDDDLPVGFPNDKITIKILKIIKEALNNVRKHAGLSSVNIKFVKDSDSVVVLIADNGKGFDTAKRDDVSHQGLKIMKERAVEIGAAFNIRSETGIGTTIELKIGSELV